MVWCFQFGKPEGPEGHGVVSCGQPKGLEEWWFQFWKTERCNMSGVFSFGNWRVFGVTSARKYRRRTTKGQALECLECVDKHVHMLQQHRSITNNVQQLWSKTEQPHLQNAIMRRQAINSIDQSQTTSNNDGATQNNQQRMTLSEQKMRLQLTAYTDVCMLLQHHTLVNVVREQLNNDTTNNNNLYRWLCVSSTTH